MFQAIRSSVSRGQLVDGFYFAFLWVESRRVCCRESVSEEDDLIHKDSLRETKSLRADGVLTNVAFECGLY